MTVAKPCGHILYRIIFEGKRVLNTESVTLSMRLIALALVVWFWPLAPTLAQENGGAPNQHEHVRYMVLDRSWPVQRIRFYPGQSLMFKLKDERGWHRGRIQAVHKNHLTIMDANIRFSEIRKIRLRNQSYMAGFAANTSGSLIGGGIVCMIAGGLNAIDNRNYQGATIAYVGAGAVAVGGLLRLVNKRTFRVGGNRKLRSI